jgi:hypothetical protein
MGGGADHNWEYHAPDAPYRTLELFSPRCDWIRTLAQAGQRAGQIAECLAQEGYRPPKCAERFSRAAVLELMQRLGVIGPGRDGERPWQCTSDGCRTWRARLAFPPRRCMPGANGVGPRPTGTRRPSGGLCGPMGPTWSASNSGMPGRPVMTAVGGGWMLPLRTLPHRSTSHPQHRDKGDT